MHSYRKFILPLLAALGFASVAFPVAAQSNSIRFERFTVEDGLSQNAILAIAQDAQGFLWFGTEDGLNKYDGYQFVVHRHDPEDPASLADSYISTILVDRKGELWVGTRSGLDRFDRNTREFVHYPVEVQDNSGLQGKWVTSIVEDQQGMLWIGTFEGGLSVMDRTNESFVHYRHDEKAPTTLGGDSVSVVYEDAAGNLWIGTQNGLDRLDSERAIFTHFLHDPDDPSSLSDNSITTIHEDDQGYLWIGTGVGGINRFDLSAGTFRRFQNDPERPDSLSHDRVRTVYQDQIGNLWIGTQNGLNLLAAENLLDDMREPGFEHYRYDPFNPDSLGSSAVWSIYEDRSGVMWFGTWGGGLGKYNQSTQRFKLFQHSPSQSNRLSDNIIWSILEDSRGRLWVGTLNGGLNMLDRRTGELVVYRHDESDPQSLLSDDVRSILEDTRGLLWVGTAAGLEKYNPRTNRFTHLTYDPEDPDTLSGDQVITLLQSRSGAIWVGTRYDGLNRLNPSTGEFTRFQHDPEDPSSLGEDRVWALYEDHLGAIWVGTLGGVSVLDPEKGEFTRYQHDPEDPTSLSSDSVFAFYEDPDGYMWIGTWGGGLNRFDRTMKTFKHYTVNDGLPNDSIYGIELDPDGRLWMSTNWGLSRFDPRSETFQNYDISDGLQDNEFNVGAHFTSESGEMFFGGVRGFNAFVPDEIQKNPYIPPIVITTFSIFNEPARHDLPPNEHIELSYKENFIAFEFSALDFNSPGKNQYAYRLEGLDDHWIEAGTRRYVSYTNLEGGDYVFRVKGSNNDGVWNDEGASVRITVTPPFWETTWFRALALVALIASVLGGLQLRVRAIEARSKELEETVQKRTREIEQRTGELDALYRADGELIRHLEIEQVFQTLVNIAVEILHADKGALFFWEGHLQELVVRAAVGIKPKTLEQMRFTTDEGTIGGVMTSGFMHVPIQIGDEIYGVFTVAYLQPRGFGAEELRLFTALAKRAALAIEQAQLRDQAQQTAILEERQRLARDLHDEVTQTLFSATLVAEALPTLWKKDPELGRSRLETLGELARGALAEMRTLLIELRPAAIAEADLEELMRQLAESTTGRARIPVDYAIEGDCELSSDLKIVIYRVAQEALNNVAKHSKASRASIDLLCGEHTTVLRVEDNGIGFSPDELLVDQLGQKIMRERAESVGAEFSIESAPEEGTRVILKHKR
jgi:ligand-binding sensor domain-containing protein/signal transduction histidine kinase